MSHKFTHEGRLRSWRGLITDHVQMFCSREKARVELTQSRTSRIKIDAKSNKIERVINSSNSVHRICMLINIESKEGTLC